MKPKWVRSPVLRRVWWVCQWAAAPSDWFDQAFGSVVCRCASIIPSLLAFPCQPPSCPSNPGSTGTNCASPSPPAVWHSQPPRPVAWSDWGLVLSRLSSHWGGCGTCPLALAGRSPVSLSLPAVRGETGSQRSTDWCTAGCSCRCWGSFDTGTLSSFGSCNSSSWAKSGASQATQTLF